MRTAAHRREHHANVFVAAVSVGNVVHDRLRGGRRRSNLRLPRVSETPDDPDTAAAFQMIRARGGQLINLHLDARPCREDLYARQMLTYALRFDADDAAAAARELAIMRTRPASRTRLTSSASTLPIARLRRYSQSQIDQLADWQGSSSFDTLASGRCLPRCRSGGWSERRGRR